MMSSNRGNYDLKEEKELVRQAIKDKFKELNHDELQRKTAFIEEKLQALPAYIEGRVLMFYWSLPGEVETKNLISKAKEKRKIVALPVVIDKNDIQPYEFNSPSQLIEGPLRILQPDSRTASPIDVKELDVVMVPGVAFDRQGGRLGRGKGCYDRFLSRLSSKTCTIGLAFDFQILEHLPFSPLWDEKVDLVITA